MKRCCLPGFAVFVFLAACSFGPPGPEYRPRFPEMPAVRGEILGPASWRLEWIDSRGTWVRAEGTEAELLETAVSPAREWASPMLAWPFWPEKGIFPGQTAPAGALFPWDVDGDSIVLGWKAGVDAFFWRELAAAGGTRTNAAQRVPWNFNWPAFRELLAGDEIPTAVRRDPWLADWSEIARRTVESGFGKRRVTARQSSTLALPGYGSVWAGPSVFADIVEVPAGENPVLPVFESPETWVCETGVLRCRRGAWVFVPWPEQARAGG